MTNIPSMFRLCDIMSIHPISEHEFNEKYISSADFAINWNYNRPVVYILKWTWRIYVWETVNAYRRMQNHIKNKEKSEVMRKMRIIYDMEYNKSATLDIESKLIQYIAGEEIFVLQNKNDGLRDHNYFDREKYIAKFEVLRKTLKDRWVVHKDLKEIQNSDLFKYSPYKALNPDQYAVVENIYNDIKSWITWTYLVKGEPWTWKSVVASYLMKYLKDQDVTKTYNIALVVPMAGLRKTFKKVFKNIAWLKPSMVIWPNDLAKLYSENKKVPYDVVIVDESHRLQQRKNITNYKWYDDVNKKLWNPLETTQLEWILWLSKTQILLYDSNQSIKPADVNEKDFQNMDFAKKYELKSQMRVKGWSDYLSFVNNLFDWLSVSSHSIKNYDFKTYDNFSDFRNAIFARDEEFWLSRIVAWYARPWKSKKNPNEHDIEIDWVKMFWNSTNLDRVNSPNTLTEIGCIHTVQWYDLNYVWVIIGDELSYDESIWWFFIKNKNYHDKNGKNWIKSDEELKKYIINIYKTLFTRGIEWTYVYIVDEKLREYMKKIIIDIK